MNTDKTENEFKQFFHELRAQDEQRAPGFENLARPSAAISTPRVMIPRFRLGAMVAAAAVVLVTAIGVADLRSREQSAARELAQWSSLSNWEAPTDALLNFSSLPLGSTIITPSDSLFETITLTPDTTTENL
jgi:hypothetical protein